MTCTEPCTSQKQHGCSWSTLKKVYILIPTRPSAHLATLHQSCMTMTLSCARGYGEGPETRIPFREGLPWISFWTLKEERTNKFTSISNVGCTASKNCSPLSYTHSSFYSFNMTILAPHINQGCNFNTCTAQEYFDYEDGYEYRNGYAVGSILVNPGCVYYGFDEGNFEGDVTEITAGK